MGDQLPERVAHHHLRYILGFPVNGDFNCHTVTFLNERMPYSDAGTEYDTGLKMGSKNEPTFI